MGSAEEDQHSPDYWSLADGALDTLGCIFNTMGSESFLLDTDSDPDELPELCTEAVRHIENGSAAPALQIEQADAGTRNWGQVRRFYVDRRRQEKSFVTDRLQDYQHLVEGLVIGLRQICEDGNTTEQLVIKNLNSIEHAVDGGQLSDIKRALADTISNVSDAFIQQKSKYEQQIQGLHERMTTLREDLVAVREEMKLDALTSIFNRGAFDASITRCLNLQFMLNQPISMIMIDVDNFKSINDSFGHTIGDDVLKSVAACLSRAFIRKNDLVARYGGDEFAVILPDTSIDKSRTSINRFLDNVRKIRIAGLPDDIAISCSVGCTQIIDDDTVDSLIARADAALYDAKAAGRNCLRFCRLGLD